MYKKIPTIYSNALCCAKNYVDYIRYSIDDLITRSLNMLKDNHSRFIMNLWPVYDCYVSLLHVTIILRRSLHNFARISPSDLDGEGVHGVLNAVQRLGSHLVWSSRHIDGDFESAVVRVVDL